MLKFIHDYKKYKWLKFLFISSILGIYLLEN